MRKPIVGTVLLVVLFFVATAMLDGSSALAAQGSKRAQPASGYDGETLFRGLFFGTGPVAAVLPEIWADQARSSYANAMQSPAGVRGQAVLIERIGVAEPSFFATFKADVQSGDYLRVNRALLQGVDLLTRAVHAEGSEGPGTEPAGPSTDGTFAASSSSTLVSTTSSTIGSSTSSAFVTGSTFYAVFRWHQYGPESDLRADVWVEIVTTRLALR